MGTEHLSGVIALAALLLLGGGTGSSRSRSFSSSRACCIGLALACKCISSGIGTSNLPIALGRRPRSCILKLQPGITGPHHGGRCVGKGAVMPHSAITNAQSGGEKERPLFSKRLGVVQVAVWVHETENGTVFNAQPSRSYRDAQGWHKTNTYSAQELLLLAETARQAALRIFEEQSAAAKQRSGASDEELEFPGESK